MIVQYFIHHFMSRKALPSCRTPLFRLVILVISLVISNDNAPSDQKNKWIYEGSYFVTPREGGGHWTTRVPLRAGASYGPINLDSYRSWAEFNGVFDRFKKISFSAKLGRLKVGVADFPIVISMVNYKENQSKWWIFRGDFDFETTSRAPKWKFSKSVKNPIKFGPWTEGIQVYRSVGRPSSRRPTRSPPSRGVSK